MSIVALLVHAMVAAGGEAGDSQECFTIEVVDGASGRGVPLVELKTVDATSWWSDSQGIVAFAEPALMGVETYFGISTPGYELPRDGFGNRGVRLKPVRGGSAKIVLTRTQIAERLYRFTGAGIDRDSVLAGRPVAIRFPLMNGQVAGQDTVTTALYRGRIHWFFGDTNRPAYPLGNFGVSGAVSELPDRGGLDPGAGIDLDYFVDAGGFSRPMVALTGPGAHWIEAPFVVRDERGRERLAARVATHRDLGPAVCWHLMLFDDEKALFEPVRRWEWHEGHDSAHPFHATVDGVEWCYLFPNLRVKAQLQGLEELDRYEALTCVAGDGRLRGNDTKIERDAAGRALYRWKGGADRLAPGRVAELVAAGVMKREESWIAPLDFETGAPLAAGRGSVFWNDYLQRFILLCSAAVPGEIWFAQGDTPVGPWGYARRVATHGDYNFYNPTQEPLFDQERGRRVHFAGTYTTAFSAAKFPTPRYDYNELMYRLTLDEPRLQLPFAIYRVRDADGVEQLCRRDQVAETRAWERIVEVSCFALPSPFEDVVGENGAPAVPLYAAGEPGAPTLSLAPPTAGAVPLFFGLPLAPAAAPEDLAVRLRSPALVVLTEWRRSIDGRPCCSIASAAPAGCDATGRPLCRVFKVPTTALVLDWKAVPIDPRGR